MAFDLGIELRLLEMRARQVTLQLDDVDAVGGETAERLVERRRHALHAEQESGHALDGAPVGAAASRENTSMRVVLVVGILDVAGQHLSS